MIPLVARAGAPVAPIALHAAKLGFGQIGAHQGRRGASGALLSASAERRGVVRSGGRWGKKAGEEAGCYSISIASSECAPAGERGPFSLDGRTRVLAGGRKAGFDEARRPATVNSATGSMGRSGRPSGTPRGLRRQHGRPIPASGTYYHAALSCLSARDYFHSIVDKDGSPATVEIAYPSSIFELFELTRRVEERWMGFAFTTEKVIQE
ncbi:hypothetical protein HPB47_012377 [Ixodes persulcatus]|uniref:Uncharacterized protein n=1 Tax=Ixodes persulcatus TaxID=34615 RepID=A0AC60NTV5_IXOPE|nr:hypothetical protein HPB47_012377 [Ixodes persulcatus]